MKALMLRRGGSKRSERLFQVDCSGDCLTQQQFKDEVDVTTIVNRFLQTGRAPAVVRREAFYGDFTGLGDVRSAMDLVQRSNAAFMDLPPEIREQFDNDARSFADYISGKSDADLEAEGFIPVATGASGGVPAGAKAPDGVDAAGVAAKAAEAAPGAAAAGSS